MPKSTAPMPDLLNADHEVLSDGRTVWVNGADGMSLGRFSRTGIDIHKNFEEQLKGGAQCLECTHTRPTIEDWDRFRQAMMQYYEIEIEEHHRPAFLDLDPQGPSL